MKPAYKLISFVIALLFLTSACQFGSSIAEKAASSAGQQKAQELFRAAPNPLNLELQLDEANTVSASISAKGGQLSATGADGTLFTLDIPAGALLTETEIRMTPVRAIANLPISGGLGGAVTMEPDGLFFYQDVFMTITPATDIPIERQIMFGFDSGGGNMGLAMPVVDSKAIRIRMQHFSGVGVGNGLSAEKAAIYSRIADRAETRITNALSQKLGHERQLQLLGADDASGLENIGEYFTAYENDVVKSRIKAAMAESASCADGNRAIQTYLGFERQRQLLGISASNGLSGILDLLAFAGKKCVDEEATLCTENHVITHMIPLWLGIKHQYALLGYDESVSGENELMKYVRQKTEACLHFELQFYSAGQLNDDTGHKIYSSKVESRVKLKFDGADLFHIFVAEAPLVNTDFQMVVDNSDCSVVNIRGGGSMTVQGLAWKYEQKNGKDVLTDIILRYSPGFSSESYTITCPDSVFKAPPGAYWTGIFMVLHYPKEFDLSNSDSENAPSDSPPEAPPMPQVPDLSDVLKALSEGSGGFEPTMPLSLPAGVSAGGGYLAKNWKISGGDIIATKEWELTDPATGLVETGQFILFHRPVK